MQLFLSALCTFDMTISVIISDKIVGGDVGDVILRGVLFNLLKGKRNRYICSFYRLLAQRF